MKKAINISFCTLLILVVLNCKKKETFDIEDYNTEFSNIIISIIKNNCLEVNKNSENKHVISNYLLKKKILATKPIEEKNESNIIEVKFDFEHINDKPINQLFTDEYSNTTKYLFNKKDSLFLIVQNKNPDSIILPKKILASYNTLSIKEIKNRNNLKKFTNFYQFTIPIISKNKDKAYIEVEYDCGNLCGGTTAFFLTKNKNNLWEVKYKWSLAMR